MSQACSIFECRHAIHRSHQPKVASCAPSHSQNITLPLYFFALCARSDDWGHVAGKRDARGRARAEKEEKSRVSCGVRFPVRTFFPDVSFFRPSTPFPIRGRCVCGLCGPAEQKKVGSSGKFLDVCLQNEQVLMFSHSVCFFFVVKGNESTLVTDASCLLVNSCLRLRFYDHRLPPFHSISRAHRLHSRPQPTEW